VGGEEPRWQHTDALCISRSMQLHNIEDPSNLQVLTAVSEPHPQPDVSATASVDDAANNEHAGRLGHIGLRRPTWVEMSLGVFACGLWYTHARTRTHPHTQPRTHCGLTHMND
jgi:hypothetical protein